MPEHVLKNRKRAVGMFWTMDKKLTAEATRVLTRLAAWFTAERMESLIVPRSLKAVKLANEYENNGEPVSLRVLEWLVTNYAKKHAITLLDGQRRVDIAASYKQKLSQYKRGLFDMFRRSSHRLFYAWPLRRTGINNDNNNTNTNTSPSPDDDVDWVVLSTSVGQLNSIMWTVQKTIMEYAIENKESINAHMQETNSEVKQDKQKCQERGIKRKRQQLTEAPKAKVRAFVGKVSFASYGYFTPPVSDDEDE
eukprot:TRINITY_DN56997_c0_g1_i1.p1 TRINITY_DN56997_c0_g1~~TRINITY_DN56997_c0_g1_i1.p1  ORF type:complete len:269 (+),score=42.72 TRINITY_DN56997_c0_g1_i1:57-809(+)